MSRRKRVRVCRIAVTVSAIMLTIDMLAGLPSFVVAALCIVSISTGLRYLNPPRRRR